MARIQTIQFATKVFNNCKPTFCNTTDKFWRNGVVNIVPRSTPFLHEQQFYCYTQKLFLVSVRLKWVKNRGFDHIVNKEMELKAMCMLKDIIKKHPGGCLPVSFVSKKQKELGLTIQVMRFLRRYPTIFKEFVGPKYNVPWFRLTEEVLDLDEEERRIRKEHEADTARRLCKLLMMSQNKKLPLQSIDPLKWDLGLQDDYVQTLVPNYPDYFSVVKMNNRLGLSLVSLKEEFAVSALQKRAEAKAENETSYRKFKQGVPLAYEMNYPRGYGLRKKVISWMDEWQKLPYISPYEDWLHLDPNSELMEKRVVGVFHELLNLTIHKKTERNNLRPLREEMCLPHKFTRLFTRYPGIFYLSRKCSTTTVTLREAYKSGQLLEKHPLVSVREKYFYMMRMGIRHRTKGVDKINFAKAEDSKELEPNKFQHGDDGDSDRSFDQGLFDESDSIENEDSDDSMYDDDDNEELLQEDRDVGIERGARGSARPARKNHS